MTTITTRKRGRCGMRNGGRIVAMWMLACTMSLMGIPSVAFAAVHQKAGLAFGAPTSVAEQPNVVKEGMWGTSVWTLHDDGVLELGFGAGADTSDASPWAEIADQVKTIKVTGAVEMPESVRYLFADMGALESIEGMDRLDWTKGSMCTDSMFEGCASLAEIDLSRINIGEPSHEEAYIDPETGDSFSLSVSPHRDSSSQGMFDGCTSLERLVMGLGWCEVLNGPDIVGRYDDGSLKTAGFPVTMVDEAGAVHKKNTGVPYGAGTYMRYVPDYGRGAVASGTWGTCDWFITSGGVLCIDEGAGASQESDSLSPWVGYADEITRICFTGNVTLSGDFNHLFAGLTSLEAVDGAKDGFANVATTTFWGSTGMHWSTVSSVAGLFEGCTSLTSVDLAGLPLPGCHDCSSIFAGCSRLEKADLSALGTAHSSYDEGRTSIPGFPLRDMRAMFEGCEAMQTLIVGENWGQPTAGFDEGAGDSIDWCATFPVAMTSAADGASYTAGERIPDGAAAYEALPDRENYHAITIASHEFGEVGTSATLAMSGETITVKVLPDWGYRLKSLTVRDSAGTKVFVEETPLVRLAVELPYPYGFDREFSFQMPDGDVEVTATFSPSKGALSVVHFDANGGEGYMGDLWYDDGREARPLPANAFTREGHVFAGWSTEPGGAGGLYAERAEFAPSRPEATLYAQWGPRAEPGLHAVRIEQPEGGTVSASAESAAEGEFVTVYVTPDEGYELEWVSVANSDMPEKQTQWRPPIPDNGAQTFEFAFTMSDYDVTVTASFRATGKKNVIVTFDAGDGSGTGTGTATSKILEIEADTPLELTDFGITREGYSLVGWRDGSGTVHKLGSEIIVEDNMTLKAVWTESTHSGTETHIVAFEAGFENLLPWMNKVEVPSGSTVTMASMGLSRDGYDLAGWRDEAGDIQALGSEIIVNHDMRFTAVWNRMPENPETLRGDLAGEQEEQLQQTAQEQETEVLDQKQSQDQEKERMLERLANEFESKTISYAQLLLRSTKQTGSSVKLQWKKCSGAANYVVFGSQPSGDNFALLVVTKNTEFIATEIDGDVLRSGTACKFTVIALDKTGDIVALSQSINVTTTGGKYTNAKSVKVAAKSGKVKLAKGKKFKLKGRVVKANPKLSLQKSAVSYESTNPRVATVTSTGVVKARKPGTCYVYAYSQAGVYKRVKVTVSPA